MSGVVLTCSQVWAQLLCRSTQYRPVPGWCRRAGLSRHTRMSTAGWEALQLWGRGGGGQPLQDSLTENMLGSLLRQGWVQVSSASSASEKVLAHVFVRGHELAVSRNLCGMNFPCGKCVFSGTLSCAHQAQRWSFVSFWHLLEGTQEKKSKWCLTAEVGVFL